MTQLDRIAKARMNIILAAPFFGTLLMRTPMVRDDNKKTFCTNGKVIKYNEAFAAMLSDSELCGVLVHEVAHCALGHLWRIGKRNLEKWNIATDHAVNKMLLDYVNEDRKACKGTYVVPWSLPKGCELASDNLDLSAEERYARMPDAPPDGRKQNPQNGQNNQPGSPKGQPGNTAQLGPQDSQPLFVPPASAPAPSALLNSHPASVGEFEQPASNQDGTSTEDEWKVAITQAATIAKMRGQLSDSLRRVISEVLEPRVPWRQVIREFIRVQVRDDYNWKRPNRRYLHRGFALPSLSNERMGRLDVAIDTSGSISKTILDEFAAEAQAALDECNPISIRVIYCDAKVHSIEEYQPGDDLRKLTAPKGGGGTAFEPVFQEIAKQEEPPSALIYLTDGDGSFPKTVPDYPVLWARIKKNKFPFGQVVDVK